MTASSSVLGMPSFVGLLQIIFTRAGLKHVQSLEARIRVIGNVVVKIEYVGSG
jgi:hypothetical protein